MAPRVVGRIGSGLGAFTIVCGFALMWVGAVRDVSDREVVGEAFQRAVEIDPATPDPSRNGQMVIAAGTLSGSGPIGDQFLKPGDYVVLQRNVEMLQWVERFPSGSDSPDYRLEWVSRQVDFFRFQQPQGHENPLLTLKAEKVVASNVKFSGFDGTRIAAVIDPKEVLEISPEMLAQDGQEIAENKIAIHRDPSSKVFLLGDMRVWYTVARPGPYTVMAVQADERTLLGSGSLDSTMILPGALSKEECLYGSLQRGVQWGNYSIMVMGAAIFFVGLCSILANVASRLDLRPKLPVQGAAAALVLAVGITLAVLFVFFVLALIG